MEQAPALRLTAVVPGSPDARALAGYQPQEHVRVGLAPAGHPFCLYLPEQPAS
jgi:hypothetical protein